MPGPVIPVKPPVPGAAPPAPTKPYGPDPNKMYPEITARQLGGQTVYGYWEPKYDPYGQEILSYEWKTVSESQLPSQRAPTAFEEYGKNTPAYLAYLAASNPTAFQQYQQDPQAYARMQQSGRAPTEGQLLLAGGSKEAGIPGNPYLQQVLGLVGGGSSGGMGAGGIPMPSAANLGAGTPPAMTAQNYVAPGQNGFILNVGGNQHQFNTQQEAEQAYNTWARHQTQGRIP